MYRSSPGRPPSALRILKMFWLRFASSTNESGHTAFISSSLETTSRLWRTRMRSVSKALGVMATG